jgi:hypothetical protein
MSFIFVEKRHRRSAKRMEEMRKSVIPEEPETSMKKRELINSSFSHVNASLVENQNESLGTSRLINSSRVNTLPIIIQNNQDRKKSKDARTKSKSALVRQVSTKGKKDEKPPFKHMFYSSSWRIHSNIRLFIDCQNGINKVKLFLNQ